MEQLALWCASACLFVLAMSILTLAILRYGAGTHSSNRRISEIDWQIRNPNTDWWLEINQKTEPPKRD